MGKINIIKASGVRELFDENRVRDSLKRAGARQDVIDKIMVNLIGQVHDGMTTAAIYRLVFDLFNEYQSSGWRYSLKQALMELGPSGHPFEQFMAKILQHLGYQTKTNVMVKGKCVEHEIDIEAEKDKVKYLIECKFHNRPGTKSDTKDALYTQARFEDAAENNHYQQVWLITNTKLTTQAISYGNCQGIKLTAWHYPVEASLEKIIETNQLFPVTCLSFLKPTEKRLLLTNGLILLSDFKSVTSDYLTKLGVNSNSVKEVKLKWMI